MLMIYIKLKGRRKKEDCDLLLKMIDNFNDKMAMYFQNKLKIDII